MKAEKIIVKGSEFLKVSLVPICQKNKVFYTSKISAEDFLNLFTVEPAEYDIAKQTALAIQFPDDKEYYKYLINKDNEKLREKPFERKESQERINKIRVFLNEEDFAFFPNTIIVSCELINDTTHSTDALTINDFRDEDIAFMKDSGLSFLEKNGVEFTLYIPYKNNTLLIIDGQHRIKGLKEANADIKSSYELLVAFIIGVDRSIIAKQFYTINYYQKPVNKSLLYHLSGEFSEDLNEIAFLHEAVKILNEIEYSPFYKRIKMLGTIPEELDTEIKQRMTISQAFLIDYLKRTISASAQETLYPSIFLYYFKRDDLQIEIIRFLIKYFKAVEQLLPDDWTHPQRSLICKTIGVGALIRVMYFLFVKAFIGTYKKDVNIIKKITTEELATMLRGIEHVNFSTEGPFGGAGSSGSLNRLKAEIIGQLRFLTATTYEEFIPLYKSQYLSEYFKWYKHNT